MGFKEIIKNIGNGQRNRKEMISRLDEERRIHKIVEDRTKSSNERELEMLDNEEKEKKIKERLEEMRKRRDDDIKFSHNALDTKNITNSVEWDVLKERNQFAGRSNMFANQKNIHQSNMKLLNNGNILKHKGNMLSNQGVGLI